MISIHKITQVTGHKGSIFTLQHQDDDHFLSAGGEGWVVSWNLIKPDPGKLIARVESNVFSLYRNEDIVIAGDMNGGLHWVNLASNTTTDIQHHRKGIFGIYEFNGMIHALGGDGYLSRRPLNDPRTAESTQISQQSLRCQTFIDDDTIVVGSSDGSIYFIDSGSLLIKKEIKAAHDNSVFALAYNESTNQLISGGRDAQIKVWDSNGEMITSLAAHMYTVNALTLNTDGSLLFSGSRDKTIKIWDATSFQLLKVIEGIRDGGHLNSVNSLLWCPSKNYLVSGSDDKSIGIWKIEKT